MIEGDEGEVVMPDSALRGETLLAKEYSDRPQTKSLPSRGQSSGQAKFLPTVNSAGKDKQQHASTKDERQKSASMVEAREESASARQESASVRQESASVKEQRQQSASIKDPRQESASMMEAREQSASARQPSASARQPSASMRQQLASVKEESEQPSSLQDTDSLEDATPTFRAVTPQSFRPHPRHSSADVRSCKYIAVQ